MKISGRLMRRQTKKYAERWDADPNGTLLKKFFPNGPQRKIATSGSQTYPKFIQNYTLWTRLEHNGP